MTELEQRQAAQIALLQRLLGNAVGQQAYLTGLWQEEHKTVEVLQKAVLALQHENATLRRRVAELNVRQRRQPVMAVGQQ